MYHWLWYHIFRKIIRATFSGSGPERFHNQMMFQLRFCRLFGIIDGIIIGDSEIAIFNTYETMSKFSSLVLNFGIGGTTPKEWWDYLINTKKGRKVYDLIKNQKVIWSIGGNCALRLRMPEVPDTMIILHNLFPSSWILTLPPVYVKWLKQVYPESIAGDFNLIRSYQRNIWNPRVIDTYAPFLDIATGEAYVGLLQDAVHFSKIAVAMIQQVMDVVI